MASEDKKSDLDECFSKLDNLNLTHNQRIELGHIICDIATSRYSNGLDKGMEITRDIYKL